MNLKRAFPNLFGAKYPGAGNFSLALRMDRKPFNDIRVRRAMNLAVNKQEIIDSFFKGNAELHTYPFPPSFGEVYTPLNKLPASARELYTYNPEKAKKLLAEAGYPNGFSFKAQISNADQTALDLAAMVVAYLAKVGVKLELDTMDYASYLNMMLKKTHSEGYFLSTGQTNPIMGIKKNFMTDQQWNPHMMADPYLDKAWTEAIEDPKPTEKQVNGDFKKIGHLCHRAGSGCHTPYRYQLYSLVALGKKLLRRNQCGGSEIWTDQRPHLDRSGHEEENGLLIFGDIIQH